MKLVWKHYPNSYHPHAFSASEAAEAAREQGKFWEMHDLIFSAPGNLSSHQYDVWANQLHLKMDLFHRSLTQKTILGRIQDDLKLGESLPMSGTPAFFINGRLLEGAKPFERFQEIIQQEIAQADKLIARGQKLDSSFYQAIVKANQKEISSLDADKH